MTENELSHVVIGCAMKVHSALGPGLLESAYEACLHYELIQSGLRVEAQKPLPLIYHSVKLECGYRVDLLIDGKLIIEVKAIETLAEIHFAQVLTLSATIQSQAGSFDELQRGAHERWNPTNGKQALRNLAAFAKTFAFLCV